MRQKLVENAIIPKIQMRNFVIFLSRVTRYYEKRNFFLTKKKLLKSGRSQLGLNWIPDLGMKATFLKVNCIPFWAKQQCPSSHNSWLILVEHSVWKFLEMSHPWPTVRFLYLPLWDILATFGYFSYLGYFGYFWLF